MSDYDDYGYGAEEDIIDYDAGDYQIPEDDNQCGINFEDMLIAAESCADPISEYKQIIELEKDNFPNPPLRLMSVAFKTINNNVKTTTFI